MEVQRCDPWWDISHCMEKWKCEFIVDLTTCTCCWYSKLHRYDILSHDQLSINHLYMFVSDWLQVVADRMDGWDSTGPSIQCIYQKMMFQDEHYREPSLQALWCYFWQRDPWCHLKGCTGQYPLCCCPKSCLLLSNILSVLVFLWMIIVFVGQFYDQLPKRPTGLQHSTFNPESCWLNWLVHWVMQFSIQDIFHVTFHGFPPIQIFLWLVLQHKEPVLHKGYSQQVAEPRTVYMLLVGSWQQFQLPCHLPSISPWQLLYIY